MSFCQLKMENWLCLEINHFLTTFYAKNTFLGEWGVAKAHPLLDVTLPMGLLALILSIVTPRFIVRKVYSQKRDEYHAE